jgi:ABC-type dipeptide/oligopeptide/nickel transport system ATPase subunit
VTDETGTGVGHGRRPAGEALVRITEVTKRYGSRGRPALDKVTLEVAHGESAAVMGPSGSGRTGVGAPNQAARRAFCRAISVT